MTKKRMSIKPVHDARAFLLELRDAIAAYHQQQFPPDRRARWTERASEAYQLAQLLQQISDKIGIFTDERLEFAEMMVRLHNTGGTIEISLREYIKGVKLTTVVLVDSFFKPLVPIREDLKRRGSQASGVFHQNNLGKRLLRLWAALERWMKAFGLPLWFPSSPLQGTYRVETEEVSEETLRFVRRWFGSDALCILARKLPGLTPKHIETLRRSPKARGDK